MGDAVLASVVVDSYNYAPFLRDAIDSALGQTYENVELIVVDDGSTDESRAVLGEYEGRIVPVLKANGGQASALNAGFAASRGDVVCFLDSDDSLEPTAVEEAVQVLKDPGVAKVHWPLWKIDAYGRPFGGVVPEPELPEPERGGSSWS